MAKKAPQYLCKDTVDPKTKKHVLVCSLRMRQQVGKHVNEPMKLILAGSYMKERPRMHKFLDVIGLTSFLGVLALVLFLALPKSTPDLILIDAKIAPAEVVTGDRSTLSFRYENNSEETIRNVRLSFELPSHFALDHVQANANEVGTLTFDLGDIAPTQYGYIHVTGTMFGDVGGEQVFTTTLSYTYSQENITDTKVKEHVFRPVRSALMIELILPDELVEYQQVQGEIRYTNTGSVAFPELVIQPFFPNSFILTKSTPALQTDGLFYVEGIEPGESGSISFSGYLGTTHDSTFVYEPSFAFDQTSRYRQETLTNVIELIENPLIVSHTIRQNTLTPSAEAHIELFYENTSNKPLTNVAFFLQSDTDIFAQTGIEGGVYQQGQYRFSHAPTSIDPGEQGSLEMTIPVLSSLSRTRTAHYENITVTTTASTAFTFTPRVQAVEVDSRASVFSLPLTSPIVLSTFARYWSPSGDQLGRGPLPPIVGEQTKYWIFWNVSRTTNELSDLVVEARLGEGVSFTGRQSVSMGSSLSFDGTKARWSISSLPATLPAGSQIAGVAFEVAITPTASQVGTTPILLQETFIGATDTFTGAAISTAAPGVTTALPYDTKASSYGTSVEE